MLILFFSLIHHSFAVCNSTLSQSDIQQHCHGVTSSLPCPARCQASVQAATTACKPADPALSAILKTFAFCKPVKCKLMLKQETCTPKKNCQWCNNKCQANAIKCQNPPPPAPVQPQPQQQQQQCSSLQKTQCQGQCEWCSTSQTCVALSQCASTSSSSTCQDDPSNTLTPFGYSCSSLLDIVSDCDYDLSTLDTTLKGITPGKLCPKTCSRCSTTSSSPATPQQPASDSPGQQTSSSTADVDGCIDDPNGMVAQQGFDCKSVVEIAQNNCDLDLNTLSPMIPKGVTPAQICPKTCNRCNSTTTPATTASSADHASTTTTTTTTNSSSNQTCSDDPEGLAKQQGLTCQSLLNMVSNNCDVDLNSLNPNAPKGLTPGHLCPKSCNRCDHQVHIVIKNSTDVSACKDDPAGMVAKYGYSCTTVLSVVGNDCVRDLNTLSAQIPKGTTPNMLCPKSCGVCKDASGKKLPVPTKTTQTFINGHLMSETEKNWLSGLGVQLPPGRYFLLSDGSAGLEGGPTMLNVYGAAGQKIDSGVVTAVDKTKSGVDVALQWTQNAGDTAGKSLSDAADATKSGFQDFAARASNWFG